MALHGVALHGVALHGVAGLQVLSSLRDFVLLEEHMVAELRRASLSLFGELLFYMTTNAAEQEGAPLPFTPPPLRLVYTASRRTHMLSPALHN